MESRVDAGRGRAVRSGVVWIRDEKGEGERVVGVVVIWWCGAEWCGIEMRREMGERVV